MMAAPYQGALHWIGFKKQASAGTAETTVSNFFASDEIGMDANPELVERRAYLASGLVLPGRPGWNQPDGSATIEVHASQPHPWYYALGADAVTTPAGTVRLHTITDAGAPVRCTVEGDMVYGKKKQADAYINTLDFAFKVKEIATLALGWLALGHDEAPTITSSPTFTTDPLTAFNASVSIAGSQVFNVESGSVKWDGKLEAKPVLTDVSTGQPYTCRRKEPPEVSGQLDFLDFPTAELARFLAGTPFALVITLTGDVIETTYYKYLKITLPACQYTGGLDTKAAKEVMSGTANFKASYDTVTAKQIKVEAQNTIALLTA